MSRLDPRHCLAAVACMGLAAANGIRIPLAVGLVGLACASVLVAGQAIPPVAGLAVVVLLACWSWGSLRLAELDRSALAARAGTAERGLLVVTAPARPSPFDLRVPVQVRRFGRLRSGERALLELPIGRSPPQGALLAAVVTVRLPHGSQGGFDERAWLRHHGMHVVLKASRWRIVGRRGGVGGLADRLRAQLARSIGTGLHGERRALVEGIVLGDDQELSQTLRDRFRASGLYHLLAVSGENVALVAGFALALAWLAGLPRWLGEIAALLAIGGYVLAVGAQPSVVRAGIAGALGSLAWLAARERDRWHFLLLGGIALLAWNPYTLLDAGFQLSFSAVIAIFVLVPRLNRRLEGYPLPRALRTVLAVSIACGAATAPILWVQFHAVPLLTIPANALAAPAILPLLGMAFATAALAPISPGAAGAVAWLNGWCAAYVAACARLVGGLPFAQVRSGVALALLAASAALAAAYALRQ